jgi:integrase
LSRPARHPVERTQKRQNRRFVATSIGSLPPGTHTDPAQPGLQIRVRQKAGGAFSRTWLLRFKFNGEESRILIGHFPDTTLAEAKAEVIRLRELADKGIDPRRARPHRRKRITALPLSSAAMGGKHTVEFLASEFMERHVRPRRKRPEYAEAILNRDVLSVWRGRDARTIEPHEVIDLLDGIVDRGSPVQANRTAALLGQMFKFGIHRRIVATTPVQLLYRPGGTEKARERVLTDDELKVFLKDPTACTRYARLSYVMLILLLTGQRRGELALARWNEIDFKASTWTIPDENAKAGRGHVLPLTQWAADELRQLQRLAQRSQWVLPANGGEHHIDPKQLTRSVAKCQARFAKAGIDAFTLHDLRRTARTGLARLGIEPHIAERVLNHTQEKIPGTYDRHAYLDEKRAALAKWEIHLQGLKS